MDKGGYIETETRTDAQQPLKPRYDPADYKAGSMEWLAACVLEERGREQAKNRRQTPYYLLCINHPVLQELMRRRKGEYKLPAGVALGDMDRTLWELGLLAAPVVQELMEYYIRRKRFAERMTAGAGQISIEDDILTF